MCGKGRRMVFFREKVKKRGAKEKVKREREAGGR